MGRNALKSFVITAEEAVVAYIEERSIGYLVDWRDAKTGKKVSRLVRWGGDPETAGGVITMDEARQQAEALRERKRMSERGGAEATGACSTGQCAGLSRLPTRLRLHRGR